MMQPVTWALKTKTTASEKGGSRTKLTYSRHISGQSRACCRGGSLVPSARKSEAWFCAGTGRLPRGSPPRTPCLRPVPTSRLPRRPARGCRWVTGYVAMTQTGEDSPERGRHLRFKQRPFAHVSLFRGVWSKVDTRETTGQQAPGSRREHGELGFVRRLAGERLLASDLCGGQACEVHRQHRTPKGHCSPPKPCQPMAESSSQPVGPCRSPWPEGTCGAGHLPARTEGRPPASVADAVSHASVSFATLLEGEELEPLPVRTGEFEQVEDVRRK